MSVRGQPASPAWIVLAVAAVALPLLLPLAAVPDAVFYNQLLAVAGWGAWLLCRRDRLSLLGHRPGVAVLGALALCVALALTSDGAGRWVASLVLCAGMFVLTAAMGRNEPAAVAIPVAWWLGGVACAGVAAVQYFLPTLADGTLIASSTLPGRAVGNMRQPNHLATALLCAMVWTAWLWQAGWLRGAVAATSLVAMLLALAMSASRTGALGLVVLVAWAATDRRLPRSTRWALAATPLIYALCWGGLAAYASLAESSFHGSERLQSQGDISSSRFAIWRDAAVLIAQHPWTGVGWGNFNFAWTFTPFPNRPIAFFDHTHNLPLQLAVEIGLPATAVVIGLLGWALWRSRHAWQLADEAGLAHPARAALVMLVVLALHSQLEYPLWYAYFLLPACWALGVFLGASVRLRAAPSRAHSGAGALQLGGALMLAGAAYALWDHRRIEVIFAPPNGARPLDARIAEGRKSVLFGHHADYAAATHAGGAGATLDAFHRPLHQLVDVRLMTAYARALEARGEAERARYVAQRLREFRRADAQAFFDDCLPGASSAPWQCDTRPVALDWQRLEPP